MIRAWRTVVAAVAGATAGYSMRQLLAPGSVPEDEDRGELAIAAPLANIVVAAAAGLVAHRSRGVAFVTGAALSLLLGDRLDALIPFPRPDQPRPSASSTNSLQSSG